MGGIQLTEVVKHLLIINVIFFVGSYFLLQGIINPNDLALYYFRHPEFKAWQIATHFFMHANFGHLFFNMFGLIMFGPALESALSPKRFLNFYFACALGATLLHTGLQYYEVEMLGNVRSAEIPVLGASGAIYGTLAGFATKFPKTKLGLLFLPIMLPAPYFILLLVGYDLLSGISTFNNGAGGVAHFAHVGGAVVGFLLVKYWERFGYQGRR